MGKLLTVQIQDDEDLGVGLSCEYIFQKAYIDPSETMLGL